MTSLPDDLTMHTVVYQGDIDQMGVVLSDLGGERVRVKFGLERPDGEMVPRADLEDVTETYDYAYEWGYTEEKLSDD